MTQRQCTLPKPTQGEPQNDGGVSPTYATISSAIIFVLWMLIVWKLLT